jgi:hypothetical protein
MSWKSTAFFISYISDFAVHEGALGKELAMTMKSIKATDLQVLPGYIRSPTFNIFT